MYYMEKRGAHHCSCSQVYREFSGKFTTEINAVILYGPELNDGN